MTSKLVSLLLAVVMLAGMLPAGIVTVTAATAPDYTWYDASKTEFHIDTAAELLGMADIMQNQRINSTNVSFEGKTIYLDADIDLNPGWDASSKTAPTTSWINNNAQEFKGTFDGQGHTISGMYLSSNANNVGMFVGATGTATFKNFALVNSYFQQTHNSSASNKGMRAAAICPSILYDNDTAKFENIYVDAIIDVSCTNSPGSTDNGAGGILAVANHKANVTVTNCVFAGTINSSVRECVGGMVGNFWKDGNSLAITNCVNMGSITGKDYVGGILGGANYLTTIQNCVNLGRINGGSNVADILGGMNSGSLTLANCFYINGSGFETPVAATGTMGSQNDANCTYSALSALSTKMTANGSFTDWAVVDGTTVMFPNDVLTKNYTALVKAAAQAVTQPEVKLEANTSWYDANATEFHIDTAAELLGFGTLVNAGYATNNFFGKTVYLDADVDLNLGWDASTKTAATNLWKSGNFHGTFDGQGHTISGLYVTNASMPSNNARVGFFRYIANGAVVRDLAIVNSYFYSGSSGGQQVGAITGQTNSDIAAGGSVDTTNTIENVYVGADVIVENVSGPAGGIVGGLSKNLSIKNAVFAGTVSSGTDYAGGILGFGNEKTITIEDSVNMGTVNGVKGAGGILGHNTGTTTLTRCVNLGRISDSSASADIVGLQASGTITITDCYHTNGYGQQIPVAATGENAVAAATTGATYALLSDLASTMSASGDFSAWTAVSGTTLMLPNTVLNSDYNNADHNTPVTLAAQAVTQAPVDLSTDESWYNENDSTFTLTTAAQLLGFGKLMNGGNKFAGKTITLGNDIDLNEGWDAGSGEEPMNIWKTGTLQGTFDGNHHTIRGLYTTASSGANGRTGLFRNMENGTVKNLAIENSYFTGTNGQGVGAIAGCATYNTSTTNATDKNTITNVYVDAIVEVNGGTAGGLVGMVNNKLGLALEDCVFAGTVSGTEYIGGIVGNGNGKPTSMTNCLNMGTVTATVRRAAGLLGTNKADSNGGNTISLVNCVNLGKVVCPGDVADLYTYGYYCTVTLTNCYWINGTGKNLAYSASNHGTIDTDATVTKVDIDSFRTSASNLSWTSVGEKLLVPATVYTSFSTLVDADVAYFEEHYTPSAFGWVPADVDVDAYNESQVGANGSMIYYYTGATQAEYDAYITLLTSPTEVEEGNEDAVPGAGFTLVETYNADSNVYTLLEDNMYYVYVSYIQSLNGNTNGRIRVFAGFKSNGVSYNLNTEAVSVTKVCEPALWQLEVDYSVSNGGMGYIIRLENGKFIIIDGGYETEREANNIYSILCQNNVLDGKPVIEAWFLTHGHNDHFGAIKAFINSTTGHANDVVVESFYYSLPSTNIDDIWPNNHSFLDTCKTLWPEAKHYSELHSGMTMGLSNATVEILATFEDVPHSYYQSGSGTTLVNNSFDPANGGGDDTSLVLRFTVGGQTILFFADADQKMARTLASTWSDSYMQSDFVQLTGHGYGVSNTEGKTMVSRALKSTSVLLVPRNVLVVDSDKNSSTYGKISVGSGTSLNDSNSWQALMGESNGQSDAKNAAKEIAVAYENRMFLLPYTATSTKEDSSALKSIGNEKLKVINAGGALSYQISTAKDAVRFVGLLKNDTNLNDFNNFGFKVAYKIDGGDTYVATVTTTRVFESLVADNETISATELGGKYVYVLEVYNLDKLEGSSIEFSVIAFGTTSSGNTYDYASASCSVPLA